MATRVNGPFKVTLVPQDPASGFGDPSIGRMAIDKQFSGALQAISRGEMLAFRSVAHGSAGYVAMERVTGTLEGRAGSFTLQHSGTMDRGTQHLHITVVPDSGSGDLVGLTGTMKILIESGHHSYDFEYELPAPA